MRTELPGFLGSVVHRSRRDAGTSAEAPPGQGNAGKCISSFALPLWEPRLPSAFPPCSGGKSAPCLPNLPNFSGSWNNPGGRRLRRKRLSPKAGVSGLGRRAFPSAEPVCVWGGRVLRLQRFPPPRAAHLPPARRLPRGRTLNELPKFLSPMSFCKIGMA